MRELKTILLVPLGVFLSLACAIIITNVNANVISEPVIASEQEGFLSRHPLTMLTEKPEGLPFESFCISSDGRILIKYNCFDRYYNYYKDATRTEAGFTGVPFIFGIFSSGGAFEWGFSLISYQPVTAIWDGSDIRMFSASERRTFLIDADRGIVQVESVAETDQRFYRDTRRQRVGDSVYSLENEPLLTKIRAISGSYNRIVKADGSGTSIVLESGTARAENMTILSWIIFIFGMLAFTVITMTVLRTAIRRARQRKG